MGNIIRRIFLIVIILPVMLCAQEGYEKWKKAQEQKYQEFKDKRDKGFVDFLKKEWLAMEYCKRI